jgi:hypothetical protein
LHEAEVVDAALTWHASKLDWRIDWFDALAEVDCVDTRSNDARVNVEPPFQCLPDWSRYAKIGGKPDFAPRFSRGDALKNEVMVLAEEHLSACESAARFDDRLVILGDN